MMNNVSIVEIKGEKFALLPYHHYEKLVAKYEDSADIEAVKSIRKKIRTGDEQLFPANLVHSIILEHENKIKAFREYRKLSQTELAAMIGRTTDYIRKLENASKIGSVDTLKRIALALDIPIDCLI